MIVHGNDNNAFALLQTFEQSCELIGPPIGGNNYSDPISIGIHRWLRCGGKPFHLMYIVTGEIVYHRTLKQSIGVSDARFNAQ